MPPILTPDSQIISSVQFSRSAVSDSLRPHESQHARPPCPSPTPVVHWNSLPSSWWCHPAISSSVIPSPPAPIPPSIRVFSNESTLCMRWPKYWSFSLFPAISKARFDFQKQAAYHQQICHNEHCKSLPLRIHKTNHKVATCDFLISLSQTQLRRQDIHMVYHWQFFY